MLSFTSQPLLKPGANTDVTNLTSGDFISGITVITFAQCHFSAWSLLKCKHAAKLSLQQ